MERGRPETHDLAAVVSGSLQCGLPSPGAWRLGRTVSEFVSVIVETDEALINVRYGGTGPRCYYCMGYRRRC